MALTYLKKQQLMSTSPSICSISVTVMLLFVLLYFVSLRDQGFRNSGIQYRHFADLLGGPGQSGSEVNFSIAPLALSWSWTGTVCAPQATVGSDWQESCKEEKHKWACDHFGLPGNLEGKPSCGSYTEGNISTTELITISGLEKVRHAVLNDITTLAIAEPKCADVSTFGLPINRINNRINPINRMLIHFDQDQVFHTRNCRRHHYFEQRGATATAIMSYHASIIGKAKGNRGILFTGDSMMRQQFEALVCMIRGGQVCIEHYYHSDALYVLYKDRDAHYILDSHDAKSSPTVYNVLRTWFPGYFEGAKNAGSFPSIGGDEPLMAVLYLWDVKPEYRRPEQMRMKKVSLQISSYMYWWENGNDKIDAYMHEKDIHLNANPHQTFVFLTMPWRSEDSKNLIKEEVRLERNQKTVEWIINKKGPSRKASRCRGPCRRWLVDFSTIADANHNRVENIIHKVDNTHYQCSWLQQYPQQVATLKHNRQNCRDPMNFAVIQWLLALLVRV